MGSIPSASSIGGNAAAASRTSAALEQYREGKGEKTERRCKYDDSHGRAQAGAASVWGRAKLVHRIRDEPVQSLKSVARAE